MLVYSVSENNDVKRVLADGAYDMIARRISSIYMMTREWNRICHQGTKDCTCGQSNGWLLLLSEEID